MKKYEILVEDNKAEELTALLEKLSFIIEWKESKWLLDSVTLASEATLADDWLSEKDDELQRLHGL